jgi:membrane-associated phospholipid phosphatase
MTGRNASSQHRKRNSNDAMHFSLGMRCRQAHTSSLSRFHLPRTLLLIFAICVLNFRSVHAQSVTDLAAFKGLAPVTVLSKTPEGRAALAANYIVTGSIQTGEYRQQALLPFAIQQQQALQDAFITSGDLADLADGLGTTLGGAYVARAHYVDREHYTNLTPGVADLIAYLNAITAAHANGAKYFFANKTRDGETPVSSEALKIFDENGGESDIFGTSYGVPAGTVGANAFGNSRPFQTEPRMSSYSGPDYFNSLEGNIVYSRGPIVNSPSYPSGHTTYGYAESLLLAILVPERYPEMVTRASEYGNDRIIIGAHYAMDVIGGRAVALYDLAHLLANDPNYVGQPVVGAPKITDFQKAVKMARAEMTSILKSTCGNTIEACAHEDTGRFNNPAANMAFYDTTQTYALPVVYPRYTNSSENVANVAPEAGYLLTSAFPSLTLEEADQILTETEGPGGGFLDNGSSFGVYSRIDLYAAAKVAQGRRAIR